MKATSPNAWITGSFCAPSTGQAEGKGSLNRPSQSLSRGYGYVPIRAGPRKGELLQAVKEASRNRDSHSTRRGGSPNRNS